MCNFANKTIENWAVIPIEKSLEGEYNKQQRNTKPALQGKTHIMLCGRCRLPGHRARGPALPEERERRKVRRKVCFPALFVFERIKRKEETTFKKQEESS